MKFSASTLQSYCDDRLHFSYCARSGAYCGSSDTACAAAPCISTCMSLVVPSGSVTLSVAVPESGCPIVEKSAVTVISESVQSVVSASFQLNRPYGFAPSCPRSDVCAYCGCK